MFNKRMAAGLVAGAIAGALFLPTAAGAVSTGWLNHGGVQETAPVGGSSPHSCLWTAQISGGSAWFSIKPQYSGISCAFTGITIQTRCAYTVQVSLAGVVKSTYRETVPRTGLMGSNAAACVNHTVKRDAFLHSYTKGAALAVRVERTAN